MRLTVSTAGAGTGLDNDTRDTDREMTGRSSAHRAQRWNRMHDNGQDEKYKTGV